MDIDLNVDLGGRPVRRGAGWRRRRNGAWGRVGHGGIVREGTDAVHDNSPVNHVIRRAGTVDSASPRAVQNAVTVWPDSFPAASVSRQNRSRLARRRVIGIDRASSWVRKP